MPIAGPTTDHNEIRSWAEKNQSVPTEILPQIVDGEPVTLRIMRPDLAGNRRDVRVIPWEDFFAKFDLLGLTFVYDNDATGYNELLQIESRNPYRSSRELRMDLRN